MATIFATLAAAGMVRADPSATQPGETEEPGETPRRLTAEVVERLIAETAVPLADDPDASVRWLPGSVRGVKTGPDGRQWYALYPEGWVPDAVEPPDVEPIKRAIEGQFDADAPKLSGARVALFEPDGRVWFIVEPGKLLLGYAGVPGEWIEREAGDERTTFSGAANGPANPGGPPNLIVGRHRLFIDTKGVQVYDGESWSYRSLMMGREPRWWFARVATMTPDPQGGVILLAQNDDHPLWRFHDGEWTELPRPRGDPEDAKLAVGLADGRVLIYTINAGIQLMELPGGPAAAPRAEEGADPDAGPVVDLEDPGVQDQTDAVALTPDGTVLISGARFNPGDAGAHGLVVLDPHRPLSEARVVAGRDIAANLNGFASAPRTAAWITPTRLYLPGKHESPPGVVHLGPGEPTFAPLSALGVTSLQTFTADGTLFVGGGSSSKHRNNPIAVTRSDPPVHDAEAFEVGAYGLMADGRVWVVLRGEEPRLYDGREWQPLPVDLEPGRERIRTLLSGEGGVLLATFSVPRQNPEDTAFGLIRDGRITIEGDLQLLVADHADRLREAFAATRWVDPRYGGGLGLLTDDADRLWLVRVDGVDVLVEGVWHRVLDEEVDGAVKLGDGAALVVIPDEASAPPWLVRWAEGEPKVEAIGLTDHGKYPRLRIDRIDRALPTPDGAVWIAYEGKVTKGPVGSRNSHVLRIDPDGSTQVLTHVGWPRVIEADGTVWLGGVGEHMGDESADRFAVWRDGRIVQHLRVPHADGNSRFFSVRPGSVWVWTPIGLRHLVADDPESPGRYRLGRVVVPQVSGRPVSPPFLTGRPYRFMCSPLGFIGVIEQRWTGPARRETRLVIVHLYERGGVGGDVAKQNE